MQIAEFTKTNAYTGVDELGPTQGLQRLVGEKSEEFLDRVERASRELRDRSYLGLIGELSLQLGLAPVESVIVSAVSGQLSADVTASVLTLSDETYTFTTPLIVLGVDGVWVYKTLNELVNEINATVVFTAALLEDGSKLAFRLVQQSNVHQVNIEVVSQTVLLELGFLEETIQVHGAKLTYVINGDRLSFQDPVPSGVRLTYKYREAPFTMVASGLVVYSLVDPEFTPLARDASGNLSYQASECAFYLAGIDRSYWGK